GTLAGGAAGAGARLTGGAVAHSTAAVLGPAAPPGRPAIAAEPSPPAAMGATTHAPCATPGSGVAAVAPVALRVPAIGVSTNVVRVGLNPDRTLQVPPLTYAGTHEAAWYDLGPAPGQPGAAVIVGHVDSTTGPAVFYRLPTLRPGDGVEVTEADCATVRFLVTSVEQYPKNAFPSQRVYGATAGPELRLVTCGGTFDRATGHYLSNIVVYASRAAAQATNGGPSK
ncbi:MAG: class F sortase, partial [Acidimicrobiales bacterium]